MLTTVQKNTLKNPDIYSGNKVLTGMSHLDEKTEMMTGNVYLVAGASKSGKTSLVLNWVAFNISKNRLVGFISTEQNLSEFLERLTAICKERKIEDYKKKIEQNLFFIGNDSEDRGLPTLQLQGKLSFDKAKDAIRDFEERNCRIIFIDNLTSWQTRGDTRNKLGWQILQNGMQDLIDMSKSLKVCIFALLHVRDGLEITETSSQIKKLIRTGKAEDIFEESVTFIRKPSISDIYGGAGKTQVSGILILWRPYQEFSHVQYSCMTMLILAQMRKSGSGNNIEMRYYGESGVFKEIEPPSPTTKQAVEIFTNN